MVKKIFISMLLMTGILFLVSCSQEQVTAILPEAEEIAEVQIVTGTQRVDRDEEQWISDLFDLIQSKGLEMRDSESHLPESEEYTTITFVFKDGDQSSLFLYQENGIWYLEVSFQGIYKIDDSIAAYILQA